MACLSSKRSSASQCVRVFYRTYEDVNVKKHLYSEDDKYVRGLFSRPRKKIAVDWLKMIINITWQSFTKVLDYVPDFDFVFTLNTLYSSSITHFHDFRLMRKRATGSDAKMADDLIVSTCYVRYITI